MQTQKNNRLWLKALRLSSLFIVLFAFLSGIASAAPISTVSQGYKTTDKNLDIGMAAALSNSDNNSTSNTYVEPASVQNSERFVGIVTTIEKSLLTLTEKGANVHITTNGLVTAYVSDVNGTIKKGDFLTISPLKGILQRANTEDTYIGFAEQDFSADNAKAQEVTDNSGSKRTVLISTISVTVSPGAPKSRNIDKNQPFLLLFGQSLTNKSVSQVQVIVALVIFFILLVVEGSIIYGAINSTITSIGRNPLSKRAIFKQLLQVSWLALAVLFFGLGAIYFILWA